jgi:hypothetical protein
MDIIMVNSSFSNYVVCLILKVFRGSLRIKLYVKMYFYITE